MSRKLPLTSQTKKLFITIRKNKALPKERIDEYCKEYFEKYAWIEHKGDISPTTHEVEGDHYHIVADARDKGVSLATRMNTIVQYFRLDNADGIQVDGYGDIVRSMQYLCHLNNPEKTRHEIGEISHNYEKEEFLLIMNSDSGEIVTFDRLYSVCLESHNIIEVIKALGIKNYKDWRNVIWDIWKTTKDLVNGVENSDYVMYTPRY